MTRFTKGREVHANEYISYDYNVDIYNESLGSLRYEQCEMDALYKLGKIEDFEEKHSIDFEIIMKAFERGSSGSVYMKIQNDYNEVYQNGLVKPVIVEYLCRDANRDTMRLHVLDSLTYYHYDLYFEDYGRVWSLNESDLK